MKRLIMVFILISFLLSLAGCNNGAKKVTEDNSAVTINDSDDLQTISRKLALQMEEGDFGETYKKCSRTVKLELSEEALKQGWDTTVDGMGDFIEVYEITQEEIGEYQTVFVILRYEYNGLKVTFSYNKKEELDGLWINYSPIEEAAANTDAYEEVKITFGEGDYPVTGILTLPKNVTNPPVTILMPGSGNHDVNETVGANKPFRDIAWGLAEQGIASIRYNERVFLYPELGAGEFTIQTDSLNDASDAISYALSCNQIDKDRIFVIGHSLGAMMVPKIASEHNEVKGIVILAGSPRKLEDIVYDQVMDALENAAGITKSQYEESISVTQAGVDTIKSLTQGNSSAILGYPSSYWYSLNQIDIGKLAAALTIPMYIAQGSEDWQVFADKDYTAWQELLGDKENVTLKLYDNLNHLFMTANGKTDVTEYNTPGKVDQTVIDDIVTWMKGN